jgi:hypothetical protein
MKVPTNYVSLAKHVANKKLSSMKSHDYRMLMQQMLHLCLQGLTVV